MRDDATEVKRATVRAALTRWIAKFWQQEFVGNARPAAIYL